MGDSPTDKSAAGVVGVASFGEIVELNVGGVPMTTKWHTLTRRHPESALGRMFHGDAEKVARDREGRVFLDRDPRTFEYVLAYLRSGTLWAGVDRELAGRLRCEFLHWELPLPEALRVGTRSLSVFLEKTPPVLYSDGENNWVVIEMDQGDPSVFWISAVLPCISVNMFKHETRDVVVLEELGNKLLASHPGAFTRFALARGRDIYFDRWLLTVEGDHVVVRSMSDYQRIKLPRSNAVFS